MIRKIRTSIVIFALAGLVFAALPVFAQNATTAPAGTRTTVKAETKAQIEARRVEMEKKRLEFETEAAKKREERAMEAEKHRAEIETKKEEMLAKQAEFKRDIAERRIENAGRVILATVERLTNIADRIESRIEKVAAGGGETADAANYLNAARADLEAAKTSVAEFDKLDLSGDDAQVNFELVKVAAKEAKDNIRSAHENLKNAVSSFSQGTTDKQEDADKDGDEKDADNDSAD